jgi:EAL domain-containing protein (putative c-di-GMP-specific phosphodiesterase class I)
LVNNANEARAHMLSLNKLGIRFSIDDFGTGYSSLSYLKHLPLFELKIDKSFIQDVPNDVNDMGIVDTILAMAHHMKLEVVAEGVETEAQLEFLKERFCERFQGYYFHRPQPINEWLKLTCQIEV